MSDIKDKVNEITKGDDAKTKSGAVKAEQNKLNEAIDSQINEGRGDLRSHESRSDTTEIWKAWS